MNNLLIKSILCVAGLIGFFVGFIPEITFLIPLELRLLIMVLGVGLVFLGILFDNIWPIINKRINYYLVKRKRRVIGIAIDSSHNEEIVKYCNEEVNKLGLSNKIVFTAHKVQDVNKSKLQKQIVKSNLDVMVWTNKLPSTGVVSINFTYKNNTDNIMAKIVHYELTNLVAKERAFNVVRETISADLRHERSNLLNFSLYIVALYTSIYRGLHDGILVFEKLQDSLHENGGEIRVNVQKKLKDLYIVKGQEHLKKKEYSEAVIVLEKAYVISKTDRDLIAGLALACYNSGDIIRAESLSNDLLQNHTGFCIAHLNAAFFRLKNKDYNGSLKHYKLYLNTKPDSIISKDAMHFMYKRLDEDPSELGYLFAIGFLKKCINSEPELIEGSNYEEDFASFLRKADVKYKGFVDHLSTKGYKSSLTS